VPRALALTKLGVFGKAGEFMFRTFNWPVFLLLAFVLAVLADGKLGAQDKSVLPSISGTVQDSTDGVIVRAHVTLVAVQNAVLVQQVRLFITDQIQHAIATICSLQLNVRRIGRMDNGQRPEDWPGEPQSCSCSRTACAHERAPDKQALEPSSEDEKPGFSGKREQLLNFQSRMRSSQGRFAKFRIIKLDRAAKNIEVESRAPKRI
jgi:hypothetical protein